MEFWLRVRLPLQNYPFKLVSGNLFRESSFNQILVLQHFVSESSVLRSEFPGLKGFRFELPFRRLLE
jgi:hypothetical protein